MLNKYEVLGFEPRPEFVCRVGSCLWAAHKTGLRHSRELGVTFSGRPGSALVSHGSVVLAGTTEVGGTVRGPGTLGTRGPGTVCGSVEQSRMWSRGCISLFLYFESVTPNLSWVSPPVPAPCGPPFLVSGPGRDSQATVLHPSPQRSPWSLA